MSIKMPFGKHKGMILENLPDGYLDYMLDWMDSEESGWMSHKRKRLFDAMDDEWNRRKGGHRPAEAAKVKPLGQLSPGARSLLPEFVKSGYRGMSMKLHPDKGGTTEDFRNLKELVEALEKL